MSNFWKEIELEKKEQKLEKQSEWGEKKRTIVSTSTENARKFKSLAFLKSKTTLNLEQKGDILKHRPADVSRMGRVVENSLLWGNTVKKASDLVQRTPVPSTSLRFGGTKE